MRNKKQNKQQLFRIDSDKKRDKEIESTEEKSSCYLHNQN